MEQKNKKYEENWKRKIDNHGKKRELSIWIKESMYQITKRSRRRYFKKIMIQWI